MSVSKVMLVYEGENKLVEDLKRVILSNLQKKVGVTLNLQKAP